MDGNEQTIITQKEASDLGFDFDNIFITFQNPSNNSKAKFFFAAFSNKYINFIPL